MHRPSLLFGVSEAAANRELFEEYLADDSRRGPAPEGSFSGSAGGAPCGDLVRLSVLVSRGPHRAGQLRPRGLRGDRGRGGRHRRAGRGGAGARRSPGRSRRGRGRARRPRRRAIATRPSSPRTRSTARSPVSPDRGIQLAEAPADGERVLVALSGGVDSAVAALREREAGREVVAVTLKLWADQRTDGERSCCSPEAVLGARRRRPLARDSASDARPGGASSVPAVVGPFLRGYAEGSTPNPCVLCNGELRIDAMIALADRLGRQAARDRALRADRRRRRRAAARRPPPIRPRTRPTCSPGSGPARSPACASRSGS